MFSRLWARLKPYYRWCWTDTLLLIGIVVASFLGVPLLVLVWLLPLMLVWTFVFVPLLLAVVYGVLDAWRSSRVKDEG